MIGCWVLVDGDDDDVGDLSKEEGQLRESDVEQSWMEAGWMVMKSRFLE